MAVRPSPFSLRFFLELDQLILSRTEAELGGGLHGVDAVEALDALNEVVAARIVGRVDEVEARLVDGDGVKGGENADIFHTRVLRHGAAVAVDGHVLHHVDVDDLAVEKA